MVDGDSFGTMHGHVVGVRGMADRTIMFLMIFFTTLGFASGFLRAVGRTMAGVGIMADFAEVSRMMFMTAMSLAPLFLGCFFAVAREMVGV